MDAIQKFDRGMGFDVEVRVAVVGFLFDFSSYIDDPTIRNANHTLKIMFIC